ncbi:MAG: hypothetical protein WC516_08060 [Patescibacteria group bacterium]
MDNLQSAQQAIEAIQERNSDLVKYFQNTQITSVQEQKATEENLASALFTYKKLKDTQDGLLNPLHETEKGIKALFKPVLDQYTNAINKWRDGLKDWRASQKQLTEANIVQQAQDYWNKRKEAEKTGEVVPLPDLGTSIIAKTSYHNMGSTSYRKHIKVSIIFPNLVPRKYCVPSESLLRKETELALEQGNPIPLIEGAIIEIEEIPVNIKAK